MSASQANRRASDTVEAKGTSHVVVNRLPDAVTPVESTHSKFNFAANPESPSSPPFRPSRPNHAFGANNDLTPAGHAYASTELVLQPSAGVLYYPPGGLATVNYHPFVPAIQDRAVVSTSEHHASALALTARNSPQGYADTSLNPSGNLLSDLTTQGSQGPGTSLHLALFSSISHGQLPDLGGINGETSQGSALHDTSGSYSGPSVSGFDSTTFERTFNVESSELLSMSPVQVKFQTALTLPLSVVDFPEDSQFQDPKGTGSSYQKQEAVLHNGPPDTLSRCICDQRCWNRWCPSLWDHYLSAPAFTLPYCACPQGIPNHLVPRNCPAAAMHLVVMVQENVRMVADDLLNPPHFAPPGPIPTSHSQPSDKTAIHGYDRAQSVHPTPSGSTICGQRKSEATNQGDPNAKVNAKAALWSPEAQLILPTAGDPIPPRRPLKRNASDDPAVLDSAKRQKTEPLPVSSEDLFYHGSGPKLQIRQRSAWLGMPSNGDQKRKRGKKKSQVKGKGKGGGNRKGEGDQPKEVAGAAPPSFPYMNEGDKAHLDHVLKTLKLASFLQSPQKMEWTVGKGETCDLDALRPPRSTGIGQVQEGDSVYFIFLSQVKDKFLCWICGHNMTVRKQLRALGHVRMHFEHRPFHCDLKIPSDEGEETPCCRKSWTTEEAMHDEHTKRVTLYECDYCPKPNSFATPSNLFRHVREQHPDKVADSTK